MAKINVARLLALSAAASFLVAIGSHGRPARASLAGLERPAPPLSLLTYNVHGLPWPLASGRDAAFAEIADRLRRLRAGGAQPHLVVLQEAFTSAAKRIGAEAGYPYVLIGSSVRPDDAPPPNAVDRRFEQGGSWLTGEGVGKYVDSGLVILSDYPVLKARSLAYPDYACAGLDCLADKGVLLAELALPQGRVNVATTHLVSRFAAEAPDARNFYAYRRELDLLGAFLRAEVDPAAPLVLAGDFNVGIAPGRRPALLSAADRTWSGLGFGRPADAIRSCAWRAAACPGTGGADARLSLARARDWQLFGAGAGWRIGVRDVRVLFGHEPGGEMLSDHVGYEADYALAPVQRRSSSGSDGSRSITHS